MGNLDFISPIMAFSCPVSDWHRHGYSWYILSVTGCRRVQPSYLSIRWWVSTAPRKCGVELGWNNACKQMTSPRSIHTLWVSTKPITEKVLTIPLWGLHNIKIYYQYWALHKKNIPSDLAASTSVYKEAERLRLNDKLRYTWLFIVPQARRHAHTNMKALTCLTTQSSIQALAWHCLTGLLLGSHVYISTVSLKGIITPPQPNRTNIQYISAIYKRTLRT